ncbi:MAG: hypothetical protein AAF270_05815 [Pseudomonadota bacterium]
MHARAMDTAEHTITEAELRSAAAQAAEFLRNGHKSGSGLVGRLINAAIERGETYESVGCEPADGYDLAFYATEIVDEIIEDGDDPDTRLR